MAANDHAATSGDNLLIERGGSMRRLCVALMALLAMIIVLAACSANDGLQGASQDASGSSASVKSATTAIDASRGKTAAETASSEASAASVAENIAERSSGAENEGKGSDVNPTGVAEEKASENSREAFRRKAAERIAMACYTNTKIVDGEMVFDPVYEEVLEELVAPDSEMKKPSDDPNLIYDRAPYAGKGGPVIAGDAEVFEAQGNVYFASVSYGTVKSADPLETIGAKGLLAVVFDDDDKIEHLWGYGYSFDNMLSADPKASIAFNGKVKELIAKYGEPGIAQAPGGSGSSYATGLAYVRLVDFGDLDKKLVVCYLDQANCENPDEPGAYPEDYRLEVWQYTDRGLELAYSGASQLEGQNLYCGAVVYTKCNWRPYIVTWSGEPAGPNGYITRCAYGLDDSGSFGRAIEIRMDYGQPEPAYTLNGSSVPFEEGSATYDEWFSEKNQKTTRLALVDKPVPPSNPLAELVRETNTVIAVLDACAAAPSSDSGASSNPKSSEVPTSSSSGEISSESRASDEASSGGDPQGAPTPDFETRLQEIDAEKAADPLMGGNTQEMASASATYIDKYEKLMHEVLDWLEVQPDVDEGELADEQAAWEVELQEQVDKASAENAGGTMRSLSVLGTKMEMFHSRIEGLIARV